MPEEQMDILVSDYNNLLKGYNLLLYFAGSMVMNEPTEDCVIDFWINGKLRNLPVSSSNPRFINAAAMLRESCPEKDRCKNDLISDYKRLFSPEGLPLTPAFESVYLKMSSTVTNSGLPVTDLYDIYGFGSRFRGKIPDDHLGLELLFLTHLIDKLMKLDDEPCRREMKKEIVRYIDSHILSWIPEWNKEIQANAQSLSYKAVGMLIYACAEDIRNIFQKKDLSGKYS